MIRRGFISEKVRNKLNMKEQQEVRCVCLCSSVQSAACVCWLFSSPEETLQVIFVHRRLFSFFLYLKTNTLQSSWFTAETESPPECWVQVENSFKVSNTNTRMWTCSVSAVVRMNTNLHKATQTPEICCQLHKIIRFIYRRQCTLMWLKTVKRNCYKKQTAKKTNMHRKVEIRKK